MSARLPAIPQPDKLTIAEAREVIAEVVEWANQCDDAEMVDQAREMFSVVVAYLRINDAAREGEAAMRYLEMRIGELAGPAVMGRNQHDGRGFHNDETLSSIHPATLHGFRKMAAHPEVVEQVIADSTQQSPPSRNKVLNAIRELERVATEARAERDAFEAGLEEQRELAKAIKARPGDDWRRRQQTQFACIALIDAIRSFAAQATPEDVTYALETGLDHVVEGLRTDLNDCRQLLDPYWSVL